MTAPDLNRLRDLVRTGRAPAKSRPITHQQEPPQDWGMRASHVFHDWIKPRFPTFATVTVILGALIGFFVGLSGKVHGVGHWGGAFIGAIYGWFGLIVAILLVIAALQHWRIVAAVFAVPLLIGLVSAIIGAIFS